MIVYYFTILFDNIVPYIWALCFSNLNMGQQGGEKQQAAAAATAVDMIVNRHHEIKKYDDPNFDRKLDLVTAGPADPS
jgi:hypothetical protein